MLKFLRKRTKIIIWAVIIAFVSWGGYAVSVQFEQANRSPGRISDKEVSFREYQLANRAVQNLSPPPPGENLPTPQEIEARTWEFLILSHEAKRQKIAVGDEEVRQEIARLISQNGAASITEEQYLRWVRSSFREEPREFENQLREQIRIRKLFDEVRKSRPENSEEGLKRWLLELSRNTKITVYPSRPPDR